MPKKIWPNCCQQSARNMPNLSRAKKSARKLATTWPKIDHQLVKHCKKSAKQYLAKNWQKNGHLLAKDQPTNIWPKICQQSARNLPNLSRAKKSARNLANKWPNFAKDWQNNNQTSAKKYVAKNWPKICQTFVFFAGPLGGRAEQARAC